MRHGHSTAYPNKAEIEKMGLKAKIAKSSEKKLTKITSEVLHNYPLSMNEDRFCYLYQQRSC
jgi:hypothetical protein